MKLQHIPLDRLFVDKTNMRHSKAVPDVADILPTIRKRGVIQTLVVRPANDDGRFGIVAGSRRFHASLIVADERRAAGERDPDAALLPCGILEAGDDAAAIEASLIENIGRLDPDEVTQWETFTRLVREGQKPQEIGATFGLPDATIARILALGNLLPRIRDLYRREQLDRVTIRHLTMASKRQQRAWLTLFEDADAYVPTGHQLKAWLLGGQSIKASHALFDVAASGLALVADLFGEEAYFADPDAFWTAQNAAIAARRAACLDAGWPDAVIVPPGESFHAWDYEKTPKRKGGRVYFDVRGTGEVIVHEGYRSRKEARRRETGGGDTPQKPVRPEITGPVQTYIDLHRHAAVRAALLGHPQVALRLMIAHAVIGSPLWRITPEPQATQHETVRASLAASRAEVVFGERRRVVLDLLGYDAETASLVGGDSDAPGITGLFARLIDLPDPCILDIAAIVMGETLASGSTAVEAAGLHLGLDMADWWEADDALLDLLRDREVLAVLVAEVAGDAAATANADGKAKTLRGIVRDSLDGANGRTRRDRWVPRWMTFPPAAYTGRGGVGTVAAHARAQADRPAPLPL
ncbi:MAG TPA: ParB/RepB/Spo0J family partition protein, partial [Sphingomonas sp.]|nr:ParB/RepB/Spo0J family partition protein [Sphingomonas sp.]